MLALCQDVLKSHTSSAENCIQLLAEIGIDFQYPTLLLKGRWEGEWRRSVGGPSRNTDKQKNKTDTIR